MSIVKVEYVWVGGNGELRSKTKIIDNVNSLIGLDDLPIWNYDGSSTNQAPGNDSEVLIKPRKIYPDPFNNSNEVILPLFVEEMKKHNGRRKFRAHVRTVMTTNMMVRETQVHTKSGQSEIADMEDTFGD